MLVCGLGAFGQAVVARLLPFGITLRLLDVQPPDWRSQEMQQRLAPQVVLGDMRRPQVLREAGATGARAVLLLGSDSSANFEAALQVRLLNAHALIVVRSSSDLDHLGTLLEQRLPGLTVVDPVQISAGALVQALRPGQRLARFDVDGESFEVFEGQLNDRRVQRLVRLEAASASLLVAPVSFHSRQVAASPAPSGEGRRHGLRRFQRLRSWWSRRTRVQWALLTGVPAMVLVGIPLFAAPGGWVQGAYVTLALLKGEYVDPTNVLIRHPPGTASGDGWLVAITLLYSLVGTLLTSGLVALILDQLLSARFGLRRRRGLARSGEPILLVGGGPLAVRVEPLQDDGPGVVIADLGRALQALATRPVRAVALLSGNLLEDLRHTLQLQARWPAARFAMLSSTEGAGERLGELLGGAALVSPIELGAEVVVASAFGERVEGVWRVGDHTLLQVRYGITAADTLVGRTITRAEHGYGFTALSLRRERGGPPLVPPPPEAVLAAGDQILVLATLAALRRVERGDGAAPACLLHWRLAPTTPSALRFAVQQSLARYLGIPPAEAAELLRIGDAGTVAIDPDCGALLERDLRRQGLQVRLESRAS